MTMDLFPETWRRPLRSDASIVSKARTLMLEEINEWLVSTGSPSVDPDSTDEYDERLFEQLEDSLAAERDGYEFARDLEQYAGFMPDARLVEILDGAHRHLELAYGEAVRAWVEGTGVRPKLAVGTPLQVTIYDKKLKGRVRHNGVIAAIDQGRATYTVRIPELGHVESLQPGRREGMVVTGIVLPWEEVEAEAAATVSPDA